MESFHGWLTSASAFSSRHKRPLVSLSYAQSLDGSIASQRGAPLQISGSQTNVLTHQIRSAHEAILVGIGTVLSDDPCLNVRLVEGPSPQPVILDSTLRFPDNCRMIQEHPHTPWIISTVDAQENRMKSLEKVGGKVFMLAGDSSGRIHLPALLDFLYKRGIHSLMVEGGARVITSFLDQRLVDYAVITVAPCFIGGLNVLDDTKLSQEWGTSVNGFPTIEKPQMEKMGEDMVIWGKVYYP